MDNEKIYISNLPVLPTVVTGLLTKMGEPDVEIEDIVKIIETDASLSLKILRLSNSAFYGLPRHVSTIKNAVVILGFNGIRSVVLSVNLSKLMKIDLDYTDPNNNFWVHSLASATIAKMIARRNISKLQIDPEEAFCAGLLFGIGKFYLSIQYKEHYDEIVKKSKETGLSFYDLEEDIFGITHNYVGSVISKVWKFPPPLIAIFSELSDVDEMNPLTLLTRLSDKLSQEIGNNNYIDEPITTVDEVVLDKLSLDKEIFTEEDIIQIKDEIKQLIDSI